MTLIPRGTNVFVTIGLEMKRLNRGAGFREKRHVQGKIFDISRDAVIALVLAEPAEIIIKGAVLLHQHHNMIDGRGLLLVLRVALLATPPTTASNFRQKKKTDPKDTTPRLGPSHC